MTEHRSARIAAAATAFLIGTFALPGVAPAEETASSIMRGGLLYDKWYTVIGERAPGEKHPLYPDDGKYAGKPGTTWRCKECHGWDYKGKDGAYAEGKHRTGIVGIRGMDGGDPAEVVALLKDDKHGYGDKLSDEELQDLANFVTKGQVDMDAYIDPKTKELKSGDPVKGAAYYNTVCAKCHGVDGNEPDDMKKTLAKQMGNPWEVMHKILAGQPDEQMPALGAFDPGVTVDIMSHIKTLPE